jgi:two-component system sensor histidine kinase AlgZ
MAVILASTDYSSETQRMNRHAAGHRPGIETLEQFFLPSFCDVRMVFAVIVIAELLAFMLTVVSPGVIREPWRNLGLISLFMQWIALGSAAVLCLGRPLLARLGNAAAAMVSYLLVLVVAALVTELAFWLMQNTALFPQVSDADHAVFQLRSLSISAVVAAIVLRYLYVQFQWRQKLEVESTARIQALQARIRPHFLFNSMNTIAALTRSNPATAEAAIEDLSDLFRASLNKSDRQCSLGDEITLARRYLNIEALRLGARLSVDWHMDGVDLDRAVPPLILQPLLENAIYHGIESLPEGGCIMISAEQDGHGLTITISNPVPADTHAEHHEGNRIAQENIRQRLQIAFGKKALLQNRRLDGMHTVVLHIPAVADS